MPRQIDKLIIHCSASPDTMDIGAREIDQWHKERGWRGIGYHFVIRRSGQIEPGRPIEQVGSHCKGENAHSIGICLVGTNEFTPPQFEQLKFLIAGLKIQFPWATIHGHREFPSAIAQGKTCPNFEVRDVLGEFM